MSPKRTQFPHSRAARILTAALILGVGFFPWFERSIDRAAADDLAAARILEHAREEVLRDDLFHALDVREQDGQWLYTYEYRGRPRQAIVVMVSARGRVELSRMLDEVEVRPERRNRRDRV